MNGIETIKAEEIQTFRSEADRLAALAEALEVRDQDSYEAAVGYVNRAKAQVKGIEAFFKRHMDPIKQALDGLRGDREALAAGPRRIEAIIEPKVLAWRSAERKRQEEAQRKAEEAARREAEKAREQEAKRAEAEARKAAKKGDEAAAEEARRKAEDVRAQELAPAPVAVQSRVPEGSRAAKAVVRWRFEITDPKALPREYLVADETAIRKVVGALKAETRIPGVKVWAEESMSFGSGG